MKNYCFFDIDARVTSKGPYSIIEVNTAHNALNTAVSSKVFRWKQIGQTVDQPSPADVQSAIYEWKNSRPNPSRQ